MSSGRRRLLESRGAEPIRDGSREGQRSRRRMALRKYRKNGEFSKRSDESGPNSVIGHSQTSLPRSNQNRPLSGGGLIALSWDWRRQKNWWGLSLVLQPFGPPPAQPGSANQKAADPCLEVDRLMGEVRIFQRTSPAHDLPLHISSTIGKITRLALNYFLPRLQPILGCAWRIIHHQAMGG